MGTAPAEAGALGPAEAAAAATPGETTSTALLPVATEQPLPAAATEETDELAASPAEGDTPSATTASDEELEIEKAPVIYGYMYKKSPGALRLKAWDWRFFVVANMKIIWWRDKESCVPTTPARARATTMDIERQSIKAESDLQCKGMINLLLTAAEVQEDAESQTVFYLYPRDGEWAEGATTDKHKDEKRVYVFDVTNSSHPRHKWMQGIRKHLEQAQLEAQRRGGGRSFAQSEYWEDDTVDEEQAAAAARMMWKLEDRRRQRTMSKE